MSSLYLREKLLTFTTFLQSNVFVENSENKQLELRLNHLFTDDRQNSGKSLLSFSTRQLFDLLIPKCQVEIDFVHRITQSFIWKGKIINVRSRVILVLITSGWIKLMDLETFLDSESINEEKSFEELRWPLIHKDLNEKWRVFDVYKSSEDEFIFAIGHSDSTVELAFSEFIDKSKNSNRGRKIFKTMNCFSSSEENFFAPLRGIFFINSTTLLLVHYSGFVDIWSIDVDEIFISVELKDRKFFNQQISSCAYDRETQNLYLALFSQTGVTDVDSFLKICTISETDCQINIPISSLNKSNPLASMRNWGFSTKSRSNCILKMSSFGKYLICLHLDNRISFWEFPLTEPFFIIENDCDDNNGNVFDFTLWETSEKDSLPNILFIDDLGCVKIKKMDDNTLVSGSEDNPELLFPSHNQIISWIPNRGALFLSWSRLGKDETEQDQVKLFIKNTNSSIFYKIFIFVFYIFIIFMRIFNVPKRRIKHLLPVNFVAVQSMEEDDDASECQVITTILSPSTPLNSVQSYLKKKDYEMALEVARKNNLDNDMIYKAIFNDAMSNCDAYTEKELLEKVEQTLPNIKFDNWVWEVCLDPKINDFHSTMTPKSVIRVYERMTDFVQPWASQMDSDHYKKCKRTLEVARDSLEMTDFTAFEIMNFIRMLNNERPLKVILHFVHLRKTLLWPYLFREFWPEIGPHFHAILSSADFNIDPKEYLPNLLHVILSMDDIKVTQDKIDPITKELLTKLYNLNRKEYLDEFRYEFAKSHFPHWLIERAKEIEQANGNLDLALAFVKSGLEAMHDKKFNPDQIALVEKFLIQIQKYQFIFLNTSLYQKSSILELENFLNRCYRIQDSETNKNDINGKIMKCSLLSMSLEEFSNNLTDENCLELLMKIFCENNQGLSQQDLGWNFLVKLLIQWVEIESNPNVKQDHFYKAFRVMADRFGLEFIQKLSSQLNKSSTTWKSNEFKSLNLCSELDWVTPSIGIILEWDLDQEPKDKMVKLNSPMFAYHLEKISRISENISKYLQHKKSINCPEISKNLEKITIFRDSISCLVNDLNSQLINTDNLRDSLTIRSILAKSNIGQVYRSLENLDNFLEDVCSNFVVLSKKLNQLGTIFHDAKPLASSAGPSNITNADDSSNIMNKTESNTTSFLNVINLVKVNDCKINIARDGHTSTNEIIKLMQNFQEFLMKFLLELTSSQMNQVIHSQSDIFTKFNLILLRTLLNSNCPLMIDYLENHVLGNLDPSSIPVEEEIIRTVLQYFQDFDLIKVPKDILEISRKCLSLSAIEKGSFSSKELKTLKGLLRFNCLMSTNKINERTYHNISLFNQPMRSLYKKLMDPIDVQLFKADFIEHWIDYALVNGKLPRSFLDFKDFIKFITSEDYFDLEITEYETELLKISCQKIQTSGVNFIKSLLLIKAHQQALSKVMSQMDENVRLHTALLFEIALGKQMTSIYQLDNPNDFEEDLYQMYFLFKYNWNGENFQIDIEMLREKILFSLLIAVDNKEIKSLLSDRLFKTQRIIISLRRDPIQDVIEESDNSWKGLVQDGYSFLARTINLNSNNEKTSEHDEETFKPERNELLKSLLDGVHLEDPSEAFLASTLESLDSQEPSHDFLLTSFCYYAFDNQEEWTKRLESKLATISPINVVEKRRIVTIAISTCQTGDYKSWESFCSDLQSRIDNLCQEKESHMKGWTEKLKKDASLMEIINKSEDLDLSKLENDDLYREKKIQELSMGNLDLGLRLASEYKVDSIKVYLSKIKTMCQRRRPEESIDENALLEALKGLLNASHGNQQDFIGSIEKIFLSCTLEVGLILIESLLLKLDIDKNLMIGETLSLSNYHKVLQLAKDRNKWQKSLKIHKLFQEDVLEKITDQHAVEIISLIAQTYEQVPFDQDKIKLSLVNYSWSRVCTVKDTMKQLVDDDSQQKILEVEVTSLIKNLLELSEADLIDWTLGHLLYDAEEKNFNVKLMKKIASSMKKISKSSEKYNKLIGDWMKHWKSLSTTRQIFLNSLQDSGADNEDFEDIRLAWNSLVPKSLDSLVSLSSWMSYSQRLLHQMVLFRRHVLFEDPMTIIDHFNGLLEPMRLVYHDESLSHLDLITMNVSYWEFALSHIVRCHHINLNPDNLNEIVEKLNSIISNLSGDNTADDDNSTRNMLHNLISSDLIRRNFLSNLAITENKYYKTHLGNFNYNKILLGDQSEDCYLSFSSLDQFEEHVRENSDTISSHNLLRAIEIFGLTHSENLEALWQMWYNFSIKNQPSSSTRLGWLLEPWLDSGSGHPPDEFCIAIASLLMEESGNKTLAISLLFLDRNSNHLEQFLPITSDVNIDTIDDEIVLSGLLHHGLAIAKNDRMFFGLLLERVLANRNLYADENVKSFLKSELSTQLSDIGCNLEALRILQKVNFFPSDSKKYSIVAIFRDFLS